jgi:hypothetical protein
MPISSKELEAFTKASYKKKSDAKNVKGYVLDEDLSTKRSKVYTKDGKAVIAHAGTDTLSDWKNNAFIPIGQYKTTNRYKQQEKIQRAANAKYGQENTTSTFHSQSGETARILAKKGLTNEAIALNPAIIGKKSKGVRVVRSSGDLVSALTPMKKKDITIQSKTFNPLSEHSPAVLSRIDQNLGGQRYITPHTCGCHFVHEGIY